MECHGDLAGRDVGSARLRRERRLRSWLRHERMTVAAALAEALHHSAPKVGAVPYNAPRSQKTARASGEHPGVLKEPEVQLEAATVGYVAASTPLLVVAPLAGGDEVDATTTRYLLKCALRKRQKEEEEEEEERELPKSGCRLFPPSCGRPCDHASGPVHPQTLGLPVVAQRQVPTVHALQFQVQFLDTVLDIPGVLLRQVPGSMVQKTVVLPKLQSIACRRLSLHAAEAPHGPDCSADHRDSSSRSSFFWWSIPVVRAGRADSPVPPWRRRSRSHSCSSSTGALWFTLQKTADIPQLLFVVDFSRRGAEADSHGLACSEDHRDSLVAPQHGDRCPCCTVRAGQDFLKSPLYLAVTCLVFVVRLWSTGLWTFLGIPLRNGFRMQHSFVRQWIHVWRQSTRPLFEVFHALLVVGSGR